MLFHSIEAVILLSQEFWKICNYSAPYQAKPSKIISVLSFNVSILHAKFRTISCNRIRGRKSQEVWEKWNSSPLHWSIYTQFASLLFQGCHSNGKMKFPDFPLIFWSIFKFLDFSLFSRECDNPDPWTYRYGTLNI